MRRKIQEGISPWRAPLGYKSAIVRGAKKNTPDQPDQPTFRLLQQAWKAFATGKYTKAHVLQNMTMRGLRTRGGKRLSKQSFDYVLSDVYYAGVLRDPWEGKEYMGRHIPMVSRSTFDKVQQIIAGRSRSVPHRSDRAEFPLRSLVRCTSCGHLLTGAFSRGRSSVYPYYRCFNRGCKAHESYPSVIVHREFIAFLDAMTKDEHAVAHLKKSILQVWQNREAADRELKTRRESEAKRVQDQQEQLIRMMMNQLITEREFVAQRTLLASQLSETQSGGPEENAEPEAVLGALDTICHGFADLGGVWDGLPVDSKKRFQKIALPEGYVLGRIGTSRKGRLFSFIEACDAPETSLVPLAGQSWNQLAQEINAFATILREASSPESTTSQDAIAA
jgi:site-specific DNA recombinase